METLDKAADSNAKAPELALLFPGIPFTDEVQERNEHLLKEIQILVRYINTEKAKPDFSKPCNASPASLRRKWGDTSLPGYSRSGAPNFSFSQLWISLQAKRGHSFFDSINTKLELTYL